ncbi:AraC family transcriptional regulator ligand-binding domain-containing protein [Vibrio sp. SCSIO 43140]|uniref:AraC family transcriptional regulator n=1 Tax=Vibrio sp. SCSIO 43140 TaxID=2819100 RepID=UPI002074B742|nr:AraC family transcriptional regulator [Vibrio sp. SCSIO 43140]USD63399.1 AraC family transcriptional regulator ligand-binding domain-containing protein [Vibrio sp. SCSIO 43140]
MRRANKFVIPPNWKLLFSDLGLNIEEVLAYAGLPKGLFSQEKIQLSPSQYFQLWRGVDLAAHGKEMPLEFAKVMSLEFFDVPIYAAICTPNLNAAAKRLQEYKPLIGPMLLDIKSTTDFTDLEISCYGYEEPLPLCLNLSELIFFTQLTRLATRQHVKPLQVELPALPSDIAAYESYFGCSITKGDSTRIRFSAKDANTPFLTSNQVMLNCFENELQKQLNEMVGEKQITDRVKSVLLDALPQGQSSIDFVARELAMSKRTLQRKLSTEAQSYQDVLQEVRQSLAQDYLTKSDLPVSEISFLLGFQESNSFIRAYTTWNGQSPNQLRERLI